ncbi:DUF4249 domain-containing protein [Chryseolinea sp. T2]|uniref:DUF4249 domain-containing protein n=1 Tax=Chryseolinea sp. T2 TaxID=3129255 RepID=UPI003077F227
MRRHVITIWLLAILLFDGCVEPFNAPVVEQQPGIVVDALLTDQPGPQSVRLFYSSGLNADLDNPELIAGATISITDENGRIEEFDEVSRGVYQSDESFAGTIGQSYKLTVLTERGEHFESDFIQMKPAGEITSLYYEYESAVLNQGHPELPQDAVNVYLNGKGAADDVSLLRWRWHATYQVHTFPQYRIKHSPDGTILPDPYPCSGYIVDNENKLKSIFPCECCECWPTEFSEHASVSNNQTTSNVFNRILVGKIPVDQWRFLYKYHLEVEQLSVQDDVYAFWKLVQAQQQGGANIFQPNVVKVKGNLKRISGDVAVFGIFSVSAVTSAIVEIDRDDIPIPPYVPDVIIQDCRNYKENSTNVKPPFW